MPAPAEIASIAQECFNRRDSVKLLALWTDDFQYEGPGVSFTGKERMLQQEQNLWTAFPDIRSEISTFVASDDRVALVTRMIGTHKGILRMGSGREVAATGRSVDFTLFVHMILRDGLIASERLVYDTAGLLRQLGILGK